MKSILMFIGGLTVGAGVSWIYHKNKYEEMVKEEVEELREHMKEKEDKKEPTIVSNDKPSQTAEQMEKEYEESIGRVHNLVRDNKYTSSDEEDEKIVKYKKPFVVTPEDFTSVPGFDSDTFYYHHDDIISNDRNEMMSDDDIEQILGLTIEEIKDQFGVYEDDAVYIRNMRMKCDYEILREEEDYVRRNGGNE